MRLLVVGAGATGGYFGGRLAQAGRDATFLVRGRRAEQLACDGLRIVTPHGDATIHPKLVTAGRIEGPFDAILLTIKAFALEAALGDVALAVGAATMVVSVLNWTRYLDVLTARFGAGAVLGGVCIVTTTLDDDARIVQVAPTQELAYGECDSTLSRASSGCTRRSRVPGSLPVPRGGSSCRGAHAQNPRGYRQRGRRCDRAGPSMRRDGIRRGMITLCIGGGQGIALAFDAA